MPEEDYQRYCKQLEIMQAICEEFDGQSSSERILELMQQLQQYGQPPEDLAGENVSLSVGVATQLSGYVRDRFKYACCCLYRFSKPDCLQVCRT